ncbi:MAG: helix-turn-helix domain-containing protein [Kiritimatiellae bacterium]|nr:helix-turn-helix domain-containing protein [Kiritimatiellia bacterium]
MKQLVSPGWLKGPSGIAEYAGISERTAQNWLASGRIPCRRMNQRLVLVRPKDVDTFIERKAEEYLNETCSEI